MPVATFDTLKFSKALREAGVSEKQADAEAAVLSEVFSLNFKEVATKEDLKNLEERLDFKSKEIEQRLNTKIDQNAVKTASEFVLVKWMLGVQMTLLIALLGIGLRFLLFPLR